MKGETHKCHRCKCDVFCNDPAWLCPWTNDDEIQMCERCIDIEAAEMEKWESEQ